MRRGSIALAGATMLLIATACNDSTNPVRIRPVGPPLHLGTGGSFTGAIWTAVWDGGTCSIVDANQYASKQDVGLNGGPRKKVDNGALPDGDYWVLVTAPDGKELGRSDGQVVHITNGGFDQCYQLWAIVKSTSSGYTAVGYDDTPNPGGEYKVWLNPNPVTNAGPPVTFDWSNSKTDNFKIRAQCELNCGEAQGSAVGTVVHLQDHTPVTTAIPLGSSVHDYATVALTVAGSVIPDNSTVTFYFWDNGTCHGTPSDGPDVHNIASGTTSPTNVDNGAPQTAVGAGSHSFKAVFTSGDASLALDSEGDCEPFTVNTANTSTATQIHNPVHTDITGTSQVVGITVHDTALVSGGVTGVTMTGTVKYSFFNDDACTNPAASSQTVAVGAATSTRTITDPGGYSYLAEYTGDDNYVGSTGTCEKLTVTKGPTTIATTPHDAQHNNIKNQHVTVGTYVHDTATVGGAISGITMGGTVTYTLYVGGTCSGTVKSTETVAVGNASTSTLLLPAGTYSFLATYSGDTHYQPSPTPTADDCEPFTVDKASTTISTQVHDPSHNNITNGSIVVGTFIHDTATVGGAVTGVTLTGTVTYRFFGNGACTGTALSSQTVSVGAASTAQQITTAGAYAYSAKYNGDNNYLASSDADCEPLTLLPAGKTMGFWGNNNGIARIIANGGYAANAVNIGRGGNIDLQTEAAKVLPNTTNACGKGNPLIFVGVNVGDLGVATSSKDCTAASGINIGTLNTAASQTLALGYNRKIVWAGLNPTLTQLVCGTFSVPGVTTSSTLSQVFAIAVGLINGSIPGGATTQSQLGALNQLLGCVNREL